MHVARTRNVERRHLRSDCSARPVSQLYKSRFCVLTTQKSRDFRTLSDFNCKLTCCRSCTFCCQASTKERVKSCCKANKICETGISFVDQLIFVQVVTNVPVAIQGLTAPILGNMGCPIGASRYVIKILGGYTLPFQIRPPKTRSLTIIVATYIPL